MGYASYSTTNRAISASVNAYYSAPVDQIFKQNIEKKIHAAMNPDGIVVRECRDSKEHPNAIPIQLYLDVTGSMGHIPHEMIKDGLPTLMGTLTQRGVPDAALMFGAIGDHESDVWPLQVAQFEAGDAELDMWLTRTYLEGNGGGNAGESYLLAWYFAANHIKTDAFEKRKQKGFVITIGDEPCLEHLPISAAVHIMGNTAVGQGTYTAKQLLAAAQKQNHVFHIFLEHDFRVCKSDWDDLMGKNLVVLQDYKEVPKTVAKIILEQLAKDGGLVSSSAKKSDGSDEVKVIL